MTATYTATLNLPEFPGLTLVGQIDFCCRPDEIDATAVWRDSTGKLYTADDGDAEWMPAIRVDLTRDELVECAADVLETHLNNRLNEAEWMDDRAPYVAAIAKLMDAVRNP